MATVVLIRHGTAAADDPDFSRPLTVTGESEVRRSATQLQAQGIVPDLILASPARRTAATAAIIAELLGEPPVLPCPEIYEATTAGLLEVLQRHLPGHATVALVGHNPGISDLAALLLPRFSASLPPAGAVTLELTGPVAAGGGRLLNFTTP